jgi:Tol biopolymer transport system component
MGTLMGKFRLALVAWVWLAGAANGDVGPSELWKINADGTGLMRFVDTPGETCGSPEWSPDGKFVAFGAWRTDQNLSDAHIFIVRADGKDRRDLGPGAMASWSPDGKQLVFHTYPTAGDNSLHILVMNADGTNRKNLLDHWGSPRWSRRGNRIFSILNNNIALYDLTAGHEHTILPQRYPMYWGFGVSPDGKRVCFSGQDSGLYLATLDDKSMQAEVRQLLTAGKSTYVSFGPDGKRIVFSYVFSSRWMQLYTMDVDTDKKPKRLDGQNKSRLNWGPDWSPDGKTIIFGSKATD